MGCDCGRMEIWYLFGRAGLSARWLLVHRALLYMVVALLCLGSFLRAGHLIERDLIIDSFLGVFGPNHEQNRSIVGMVKESLIQTAFRISSAAWPLKVQAREFWQLGQN